MRKGKKNFFLKEKKKDFFCFKNSVFSVMRKELLVFPFALLLFSSTVFSHIFTSVKLFTPIRDALENQILGSV